MSGWTIAELRQRLSEVEAERDKAEERVLDGERWITSLREELASLRADQERMREALETMRAALEILNSGGGLGYAKHALIAAALSSTPTPETTP